MQSIQLRILDSRIGSEYPLPDYATDGAAAMDLRAHGISPPAVVVVGPVAGLGRSVTQETPSRRP